MTVLLPQDVRRRIDYSTSPIYSKSSSFSGNKITGW